MSERRLRLSYDRMLELRAERLPGREGCPELERLLDLINRTGGEEGRLALLDHVMGCPHCQAEFELLRAAHRATGEQPAAD
jgi:hypothetical protein